MRPIVGPANRRPGARAGEKPSREGSLVDGGNPFDPGVGLLARAVAGIPAREIVLVACGDVPGIGPSATRLVLDVRELAEPGARPFAFGSDPADRLEGFGHALVWPRAHLGKDFTFACLARGALALRPGGALWCSVRKAKGADSIAAFLERLVGKGQVTVHARDRGYRLLRAPLGDQIGSDVVAREALAVRYELRDPILGDLELSAVPGVFSRRALDDGTRALIEHAARSVDVAPRRVLDLGAGVGPLACWAARTWQEAQVLAVEPNLLAAECCEANARRAGLGDRVTVVRSAGLPALEPALDRQALHRFRGAVDLALVNPPTHAAPDALALVVSDALAWLGPGGRAMFVVSRASALAAPLRRLGASVAQHDAAGYTVVVASRPC
jgi:16S rRNA G1207 methylase RsmC